MQKADVGIPTEDIMYLLEEADLNNDGTISFPEFRSLIFGLWTFAYLVGESYKSWALGMLSLNNSRIKQNYEFSYNTWSIANSWYWYSYTSPFFTWIFGYFVNGQNILKETW